MINRIIEKRIAAGKGPLGFLNPVLYRNAWALNDITNGSNPGCGTEGFYTAPGYVFPLIPLFLYYHASIYGAMLTIGEQNRWDPVTGLGTPNFPKLLDVFLNLP